MQPVDPRAPLRRVALRQAFAHASLPLWLAVLLPLWPGTPWLLKALFWGAALVAVPLLFWRTQSSVARAWKNWLDDACPELEDSAWLLADTPAAKADSLQAMQVARVSARLAAYTDEAWRRVLPPRPAGAMQLASALVIVSVLATHLWIRQTEHAPAPQQTENALAAQTPWSLTVRVQPPAYTGLAAFGDEKSRVENGLGVLDVPQDSQVSWCVADANARWQWQSSDGEQQPADVNGCVTLKPSRSQDWQALQMHADRPATVFAAGRLRVLRDRPPVIEIHAPETDLVVIDLPDQALPVRISVRDDYAVSAATLHMTLARGSGENVRFSDRTHTLEKSADGGAFVLDEGWQVKSLGMEPGDELYFHVRARDNRQPDAQNSRSRTLILRWPAPDKAGTEGATLPARALKAQFRSQRQIILDTEKLIAERKQLSDAAFAERSQAIAEDQAVLRLRYGEFLGEENAFVSAAPAGGGEAEAHHAEDGHDHGQDAVPANAEAVASARESTVALMAQVGHTHDESENATLFDEATKKILRTALTAMWKAEGGLRMRQPEQALPHEYAALEAIKTLQQADRLYLHRTAFTPSPMDESMRFSGELPASIQKRIAQLLARGEPDAAVTWLQRLLHATPDRWDDRERRAFSAFLHARLGEEAALDTLRDVQAIGNACAECLPRVLDRLSGSLPAPLPAPRAEIQP